MIWNDAAKRSTDSVAGWKCRIQWGHSGETCAAILADYEERRKRHTEASEFLETLLKGVSI